MITILGVLFGLVCSQEDLEDFEMGNCYNTPESRTLVTCLGGILWIEAIWMLIKSIYRFIRNK